MRTVKDWVKMTAVILGMILFVHLAVTFLSTSKVNTSELIIRNVNMKEDQLVIQGGFQSDSTFYHDYKYKVKEDGIYVTIFKHDGRQWHQNDKEKIDIAIPGQFDHLRQVYLNESEESPILIWERSLL